MFINIRMFFFKTGNAKYISHLDLYRAFGRAIKRSGLPVWITEGFNPHIYMTFALPLALGIEGGEESVDLRLTGESVDFAEVVQTLNAVMPHGMGVIRAAAPVRKASEIARARYEIRTQSQEAFEKLDVYLSQPEIKIVKKTKRSAQEIDVKPLLEWERETGILTLPAGSELNINPWNVLDGLEITNVKRTAVLCRDGELFA